MKKHIILFILFIQAGLLFSQAPVVSNVTFSQRTDGSLIIDIYYDLSDTDAETKKIEIVASDDNGSTWALTCTSLTGDVGSGVTLGTGKHVIWDFYADNPDQSGSQYKVRVTASEVGTMTGNDGKTYQTVKIGNQWWMAENLKETQYRDHSAITNVTDGTWDALTTEAYCAYNNDASNESATYGYLYNRYAAVDSRNIAPAGWHVPTDAELTTLITYLGGEDVAGSKMKEIGTTHWNSPNSDATNESGFTALPGGCRNGIYSGFEGMGSNAYFLSASDYFMKLDDYSSHVGLVNFPIKSYGFSVRLLRD